MIEELSTITSVPCNILRKFLLPEAFTSARYRSVTASRMPVPEAAVNEDADSVTGKYQIRPAGKILLMKAVPETMPMQQPPHLHLG